MKKCTYSRTTNDRQINLSCYLVFLLWYVELKYLIKSVLKPVKLGALPPGPHQGFAFDPLEGSRWPTDPHPPPLQQIQDPILTCRNVGCFKIRDFEGCKNYPGKTLLLATNRRLVGFICRTKLLFIVNYSQMNNTSKNL